MSIKLNASYLYGFVGDNEFKAIAPQVKAAHVLLTNKIGLGSDFTGWVDLPLNYDKDEFARIKKCASKIISDSDVLLVVGIGIFFANRNNSVKANSAVYTANI